MSDSENQQGHSSDNIERNFENTNFDGEPPLVTALTTPFIRNTARDTSETLRKIEARVITHSGSLLLAYISMHTVARDLKIV
jgi:hypothetical protein